MLRQALASALKGAIAGKKSGGGASCSLRSLAGDTRVVMSDGSLKRIDQVHVGNQGTARSRLGGLRQGDDQADEVGEPEVGVVEVFEVGRQVDVLPEAN
ncbi:hypothetical protein OH802_27420 [Nocardioides sp. NBC_00850]|uniref:hypothetical protein n=1 Tax=Nocardioides sp. NBC_00850 TaxID=2976001 RepID=UPI003867AA03|nr:hypothetical protein OH802_27420 [Nocardioides sp. NBC_00850]